MTGSLNYSVNAKDISRATLGKVITAAVQSGKIDLNVSPAVFNTRTGSTAGTEILAIAKGLNVKTDGKSVKQLIAEIGNKTVESKGSLTVLPDSVAKSLGAVSLQALVSSGDGKLNALGVAIESNFNGGKLSIEAKGVDKVGLQFEAVGTLQAKQGDTTASVEGRVNTRGGTTVKGADRKSVV